MTVASFPKAFGVWFREVDRFDPASFERISWHWSRDVMAPIASVLKLRKEKVDRRKFAFTDLQPITIHFDGSIDKREVNAGRDYTMDLFFAHPGDIVVAKIDLKNGAVGIVPDWSNVVVTNHFAVYEPDLSKVVPEYFLLLIQTSFFKAYLWRNKVGAEGRKEVKLEFFESIEIPLPPLEIQRAIVDHWQAAQKSTRQVEEQIKQLETNSNSALLFDLGINIQSEVIKQRVFTTQFQYLSHWNVRANQVALQEHTLLQGMFPIVSGRDVLTEVKHGCSNPPAEKPTALEILKISAVTKGTFNPLEKKSAQDNERVRHEFDLKKGDVLMCRTNGTLAYVGMSSLVDKDYENLIFPDKVIRVRTKKDILPEYLWLILQTYPVRLQIESAARTAVGNYAIGSDDIWNLRFPLPPLSIQKQVVIKALAHRAEIARLRERAAQIRREAEAEVEALILGTKKV